MSKPPYVRPKITKFFEADMLENYQRGSFWFGTLKRYRKIEKKETNVVVEPRFSDLREGVIEHAYKFKNGHVKSFKAGGISMTDCYFENNGADIMVKNEFNDFVFCASWGGVLTSAASKYKEWCDKYGGNEI